MCEGYKQDLKEQDRRDWERTREICWWIYQPNADPKNRARTREAFIPLGDKQPIKAKRVPQKKLQELASQINAKLNSK